MRDDRRDLPDSQSPADACLSRQLPLVYTIDLLVRPHSFSSSQVLPINELGQPAPSFDADGKTYPAGTVRTLPPSTIYGFNGTFPGPMINAEYGKAALIRFTNRLDENPLNLPRQDFGDPELRFLKPPGAPRVVGHELLQALPQPRLRRRHLHRQRHRKPCARGQAAELPVPLPGLLGVPDLRVRADDPPPHRPFALRPCAAGSRCRGARSSHWRSCWRSQTDSSSSPSTER